MKWRRALRNYANSTIKTTTLCLTYNNVSRSDIRLLKQLLRSKKKSQNKHKLRYDVNVSATLTCSPALSQWYKILTVSHQITKDITSDWHHFLAVLLPPPVHEGFRYSYLITMSATPSPHVKNYICWYLEPGYCSQYSDSLWAGRTVDRIPMSGEIFRTCPDWPWGPPNLLYNGYQVSFPGLKRPGHDVDHPPQLAPRLKKEYNYTSTPALGLHGLL
jgi:hypothetical protein